MWSRNAERAYLVWMEHTAELLVRVLYVVFSSLGMAGENVRSYTIGFRMCGVGVYLFGHIENAIVVGILWS